MADSDTLIVEQEAEKKRALADLYRGLEDVGMVVWNVVLPTLYREKKVTEARELEERWGRLSEPMRAAGLYNAYLNDERNWQTQPAADDDFPAKVKPLIEEFKEAESHLGR